MFVLAHFPGDRGDLFARRVEAAAFDYEYGGRRLVELADRLGRTEAAVRQRASKLRLAREAAAAADP